MEMTSTSSSSTSSAITGVEGSLYTLSRGLDWIDANPDSTGASRQNVLPSSRGTRKMEMRRSGASMPPSSSSEQQEVGAVESESCEMDEEEEVWAEEAVEAVGESSRGLTASSTLGVGVAIKV